MHLLSLLQTESDKFLFMKALSVGTVENLKKTVRQQARDIISLGQQIKQIEGSEFSREDNKEAENSDSEESFWEMDMYDVLLEDKGNFDYGNKSSLGHKDLEEKKMEQSESGFDVDSMQESIM